VKGLPQPSESGKAGPLWRRVFADGLSPVCLRAGTNVTQVVDGPGAFAEGSTSVRRDHASIPGRALCAVHDETTGEPWTSPPLVHDASHDGRLRAGSKPTAACGRGQVGVPGAFRSLDYVLWERHHPPADLCAWAVQLKVAGAILIPSSIPTIFISTIVYDKEFRRDLEEQFPAIGMCRCQ
jgi:hypothetical protein